MQDTRRPPLAPFSVLLGALATLGIFLASIGRTAPPADARIQGTRWFVYRDVGGAENHGNWTNFMEGHQVKDFSLRDELRPFEGTSCVRVSIKFEHPNWCGIAVACQPNYWGEQPAEAFDLAKARKLVFYARGEEGIEVIEVKVAIAGDKPFGDSSKSPVATTITLDRDWRRFELPHRLNSISPESSPHFASSPRPGRTRVKKSRYISDNIYLSWGNNHLLPGPSGTAPRFDWVRPTSRPLSSYW